MQAVHMSFHCLGVLKQRCHSSEAKTETRAWQDWWHIWERQEGRRCHQTLSLVLWSHYREENCVGKKEVEAEKKAFNTRVGAIKHEPRDNL